MSPKTGRCLCAEVLPWVTLVDDLPRYADSSSGGADPLRDE